MTNFLTPVPPPSAKMNNRIRKHDTNFKTPPPLFRVDVITVWSLRRIQWRCLLFPFLTGNTLFGQTWSKTSKLSV